MGAEFLRAGHDAGTPPPGLPLKKGEEQVRAGPEMQRQTQYDPSPIEGEVPHRVWQDIAHVR